MMRSFLMVALVVVVLVLLFQLHSQAVAIKALQQTAASAPPPTPSLELQEKCAKQAAVEYRQENLETSPTAEFTNHYSAKLGRCFVVTKSSSLGTVTSVHRLLVDAYEGKVLGNYEWFSRQGKKYWEVEPFDCTVTLPSGEEKKCKSDDEWDALAKTYMEMP